jgi:hypothetical protein
MRDAGDLGLLGATVVAAFGEARRKDDRAADTLRSAGAHRIEHRGMRNRKHRAIHVARQRFDRRQAGPTVDFGALGIDQMDVAVIASVLEVLQDRSAQRTRGG